MAKDGEEENNLIEYYKRKFAKKNGVFTLNKV